ncbi:hypothetical protein K438DRAFT_1788263 [Mycena galopus ATCC 62051]|nr:hypothetical protein K438DRAFT_1788263 [Mycena galopus ATCC 62051]
MPAPGNIALVTGLVSTSYFTFGNIGAAYFGVMPVIERGRSTLPVADRLALWTLFMGPQRWAGPPLNKEPGSRLHMATSIAMAGASLSVAGYLTPAGPLRNILGAGAVAGFTVGIYTVLFMLPLNNGLIAILRAHKSGVKPMDVKQEQHVLDELDKWRALHKVRIVLGIISWLAAITGLLASDSAIQFVIFCKAEARATDSRFRF